LRKDEEGRRTKEKGKRKEDRWKRDPVIVNVELFSALGNEHDLNLRAVLLRRV
jgi:hypothetical protein